MNIEVLDSISKGLQIMVVDDVSAARRVVTRMLGALGFANIIEASRGGEALSKLRSHKVDLCIVDLHLGDSLGTELLATVREDRALSKLNIPFIIITSDMDKRSFVEAIKAGISSYLLKPFSSELLAERIATSIKVFEQDAIAR